MKFNSPIPRSGLPRFHESSPQRIARDPDATQRLWQKNRKQGDQLLANALAIEELQRSVNRLRLRRGGESEALDIPFQIYKGSTWLMAKVTTGPAIATAAKFEPTNPDTDIPLTSGAVNYIYFEYATSITGSFAKTTTPEWNSSRIVIGTVDTTNTEDETATIEQLWPFYLYNPCFTEP